MDMQNITKLRQTCRHYGLMDNKLFVNGVAHNPEELTESENSSTTPDPPKSAASTPNTYQAEKPTGDTHITPRGIKNTVERVPDLFQKQSPSNKNGNFKPETSKFIKSSKNTHKTYAISQEPKVRTRSITKMN
ncbi:hypothetical protein JTB14_021164 [Gonioctena quinquepunctata]|nr:hypothetical protein JTB14_021164 [Gonioctena quinquepunctata]